MQVPAIVPASAAPVGLMPSHREQQSVAVRFRNLALAMLEQQIQNPMLHQRWSTVTQVRVCVPQFCFLLMPHIELVTFELPIPEINDCMFAKELAFFFCQAHAQERCSLSLRRLHVGNDYTGLGEYNTREMTTGALLHYPMLNQR